MARRHRLGVGAVVLGALGWWALVTPSPGDSPRDPPAPAPPPRAATERPPLPTRTEVAQTRSALPPAQQPPSSSEPIELPHVTCRLSEAVEATVAPLYLEIGGRQHWVGQATAVGDEITFPLRPSRTDEGERILHLPGFSPVLVRWGPGGLVRRCLEEPLALTAREEMSLKVLVVNTAGNPEPSARVTGCGPSRQMDDGHFTIHPVRAPCTLQASRQDGYWFARSQPEEVPWLPGEEHSVTLVIDEYPRGGLGVGVELAEDGVRISLVHPGTPGEAAGLAPGDLVLSVDGVTTDALTLREFVERATGEAGTAVTLTVSDTDGEEREVTLERAMLGP